MHRLPASQAAEERDDAPGDDTRVLSRPAFRAGAPTEISTPLILLDWLSFRENSGSAAFLPWGMHPVERWERARRVEKKATRRLPAEELVPSSREVARRVWLRGGRESGAFSEDWGYHIAPALFLTAASLKDDAGRLLAALQAERPSLAALVDAALDAGLVAGEDLFEMGGSFLDLLALRGAAPRSYDARFGAAGSLSLETSGHGADPPRSALRLILASAVFEEGSGIVRTLLPGATSRRELIPLLSHVRLASGVDAYRQMQARIAATELFAWSRNHLVEGGLLATGNVLGPALEPDEGMMAFLGLRPLPPLFERRISLPAGPLATSVRLYLAVPRPATAVGEPRSASVQEFRMAGGEVEFRERQRRWSWEQERLRGSWGPGGVWRRLTGPARERLAASWAREMASSGHGSHTIWQALRAQLKSLWRGRTR